MVKKFHTNYQSLGIIVPLCVCWTTVYQILSKLDKLRWPHRGKTKCIRVETKNSLRTIKHVPIVKNSFCITHFKAHSFFYVYFERSENFRPGRDSNPTPLGWESQLIEVNLFPGRWLHQVTSHGSVSFNSGHIR